MLYRVVCDKIRSNEHQCAVDYNPHTSWRHQTLDGVAIFEHWKTYTLRKTNRCTWPTYLFSINKQLLRGFQYTSPYTVGNVAPRGSADAHRNVQQHRLKHPIAHQC